MHCIASGQFRGRKDVRGNNFFLHKTIVSLDEVILVTGLDLGWTLSLETELDVQTGHFPEYREQ